MLHRSKTTQEALRFFPSFSHHLLPYPLPVVHGRFQELESQMNYKSIHFEQIQCSTKPPAKTRCVRADDEKHEMENSQHFEVTEWIVCGEGTAEEDIVLLVRLHPTYELPPADNRKDSSLAPRTPRKTISKVDPTAKSNPPAAEMTSADMVVPERNVGDKYPPSVLPEYRGPYFAHDRAQLVQRDYRDTDGKPIAPSELYHKLVEGTLVIVMVSLATYVIKDLKTERGNPIPDKKIYHVLVD
ncbi:hypothetical protein B0H19DRAFT_1188015 [Mycena capillaripes]|nr:hypothetical protein B0H19DRAFT_1188015 [Mycena capillaripes]